MKLEILETAEADLWDGFQFYERQVAGIGSYFPETLMSDIESLRLYAGLHRKAHGCRRDPAWTQQQLAHTKKTSRRLPPGRKG